MRPQVRKKSSKEGFSSIATPVPRHDLVARIFSSRTIMLSKWVMSPASLNIFILYVYWCPDKLLLYSPNLIQGVTKKKSVGPHRLVTVYNFYLWSRWQKWCHQKHIQFNLPVFVPVGIDIIVSFRVRFSRRMYVLPKYVCTASHNLMTLQKLLSFAHAWFIISFLFWFNIKCW